MPVVDLSLHLGFNLSESRADLAEAAASTRSGHPSSNSRVLHSKAAKRAELAEAAKANRLRYRVVGQALVRDSASLFAKKTGAVLVPGEVPP